MCEHCVYSFIWLERRVIGLCAKPKEPHGDRRKVGCQCVTYEGTVSKPMCNIWTVSRPNNTRTEKNALKCVKYSNSQQANASTWSKLMWSHLVSIRCSIGQTDIAIIYIDLGLKSHNTNGKFLSFVVFFWLWPIPPMKQQRALASCRKYEEIRNCTMWGWAVAGCSRSHHRSELPFLCFLMKGNANDFSWMHLPKKASRRIWKSCGR